jgi:hypothetical protein
MILYLNCNKSESQTSWNKSDYLLKASEQLGIADKVELYKGQGNPEYVLNIEPFDRFIKGSTWTGIWEIDLMLDRAETNISNWLECDNVFVANNNIPSRLRSYSGEITTLFQACEPSIHRRFKEITPIYDFVFSGTVGLDIYRKREEAMNTLKNSGFSFLDQQKGHTPQEYIKRLNSARVQFIRSGCKEPFNSQVEQRFFECLALGPVLKDYHPDLEKLGLSEGVDFFWYKDEQEMIKKMHTLIDFPQFAQKMADSGRAKALMYHTYEHRLISIFNIIKDLNV